MALFKKDQDEIWYRLNKGHNIIKDNISIIWTDKFIVENGSIHLCEDYYDQKSFYHDDLPSLGDFGAFDHTKSISIKFLNFVRANGIINHEKSLIQSKKTYLVTNWLVLFIMFFLIIGVVIFLNRSYVI